jgi:phage gpG-like protein
MPEDLKLIIGGNAFPIIAAAGQRAPQELARLAVLIASEVSRQAKRKIPQVLNTTGKSTGNLRRGVTVIPRKSELAAEVGPQAVYGAIHEFGGTIVPRTAKALAFWAPGSVVKGGARKNVGAASHFVITQKVTMPKRPYLLPSLQAVEPRIPELTLKIVERMFGG